MTDEEIRTRAYGCVEVELFNLTYDSYDAERLSQEDIDKLNDEIRRIARWFREKKMELLQPK